MKNVSIIVCLLLLFGCASPDIKVVKLKLIETSDVHGNYYPYDFTLRCEGKGSLARVAYYLKENRATYGENLLLFDNGDILQGQPSSYYYNYIDTNAVHLATGMMNHLQYDAGNIGNHDLETGHSVYDRWMANCNFPVLGANIVRREDGEPYFKPYAVFEREGVKIVVLGMITPAIPVWLHESMWSGLSFEDMEVSAHKWMSIIQEKEKPDIVVGLFHTGKDAHMLVDRYKEDAATEIAERVPGFDIILFGHDHSLYCNKVVNVNGDSVLMVNPGYDATFIGDVDVTVTMKKGKVVDKQITGNLTEMSDTPVCKDFVGAFQQQFDDINRFVSEKIGVFTQGLDTRPAYFGSSALIDFIHTVQLDITGADISFVAPLTFDTKVSPGDIRVYDMFNMYKFENFVYTMELSGEEVKGILEESYAIWTNKMDSPDDHLLLFSGGDKNKRYALANYYFLFDSAAGIIYTVDVTKPKGEKVAILRMANGAPFDKNKMYKVAVTSYRGNGGGELLIKGIGIEQEKLKDRIAHMSENDIRYYIIQYIRRKQSITPRPFNQWRFIPEEWTVPAAKRDYKYLFGEEPA